MTMIKYVLQFISYVTVQYGYSFTIMKVELTNSNQVDYTFLTK
jgi:hypothetical protein